MQRSRTRGSRRFGAAQLLATPFILIPIMAAPAAAATLMVGPGQTYEMPSQAAAVAQAGDTIVITPSTYRDCSVWTADNITIESSAPGVVLKRKICMGKAIFVIAADNVTVSGITFSRAVSHDGNGAGIRAEGTNLTVENSRFSFNQDGILADDNPASTITITGSEFDHNGTCVGSGCAHGIYIGNIGLLQVENTRFFEQMVGHHIKSRAANTLISNCDIEDGPNGTASYLVDIPNGGNVTITDTIMEKGPMTGNDTTAVSIGEEGVSNVTNQLLVTANSFTNDGPPTIFVDNYTTTPAALVGNTLQGNPVTPLEGPGTVQ
jgi:hypothetical protein